MNYSLVRDKIDCCGCTACSKRCPVGAIEMISDDEGFMYPNIDNSKCIHCGLCERICSNNPVNVSEFKQEFYAAKTKNEDDRKRSRSGGLFFEAAKHVINMQGSVYGAAIINNVVKHIRGITLEDCILMQGSKYVESDLNDCYLEIERDLLDNMYVLFSGTACQVAGLYAFLSVKKNLSLDKLFTIDIVCHGVASSKIFKDYIHFLENKYNSEINKFNFRNKSYGWALHYETFEVKNKTISNRSWTNLFYSNQCLRPSCGKCAFASYNRPGDLTIADFWGLNKINPEFDDDKGVSTVIINSFKGKELFNICSENMNILQVTKENCSQPNLNRSSIIPIDREKFWILYKNKGFKTVLIKYGRYDILRRIKWKLELRKIERGNRGR